MCLRVFPMGAFARGDLLRVLLVSILTGLAVTRMGEIGERVAHLVDVGAGDFLPSSASLCAIGITVCAAAIAAFGAAALTIGADALGALFPVDPDFSSRLDAGRLCRARGASRSCGLLPTQRTGR